MSRSFAYVCAVSGCMSFWSFVLLELRHPEAASLLGSLGLGIMLAYVVTDRLHAWVEEQEQQIVRDPRVIRAMDEQMRPVYAGLLAAIAPRKGSR